MDEWIKEEKESQDLYKRLSEKSMLFDKGLTDYMKPPDLDLALSWYEQQKPDELWSNQFDSNHHRTIAYLLTSKVKFQDEISKKELDQKNKIKSLYKWASIIGVGVVVPVTGVAAIGEVGTVHIWSQIDPSQDPNWQDISDAQNPNWVNINTTQNPNWQDIAA